MRAASSLNAVTFSSVTGCSVCSASMLRSASRWSTASIAKAPEGLRSGARRSVPVVVSVISVFLFSDGPGVGGIQFRQRTQGLVVGRYARAAVDASAGQRRHGGGIGDDAFEAALERAVLGTHRG